jgi:hypothetical protein
MRFGAELLPVGQGIDFVVHPAHRKLMPAVYLQNEITRRTQTACEIRFALPNARSLAIFRWVGYRCVGQMVRNVRVLKSAGYLSRYLPVRISRSLGTAADYLRLGADMLRLRRAMTGLQTRWLDRPDSRFDDLSERTAPAGVLMGERGKDFLTWRFVDCPLGSHLFFAVVCASDQRLLAYAVCEERPPTLHVVDFLVDPNVPRAWEALWLGLSQDAYRRGLASLSLAFLGSGAIRRKLAAIGFAERDRQPLYAAANLRWVHLLQEEHWYLTGADQDGR